MKFYRYSEYVQVSGFHSSNVYIHVNEYFLLKETPKGYWITDWYPDTRENGMKPCNQLHKWVSKTARKRWAYPDRQQAWESFKRRKSKQRTILERQLEKINATMKTIKDMEYAPDVDIMAGTVFKKPFNLE